MPSVIRSASEFSASQLVLQAHKTKVSDDGFVQVSMSFACLASALQQNLALFRMEAAPPASLPADVRALPLQGGSIYLSELNTRSAVGIGYIDCLYVGSSLDQKRRIVRAEVQRSFSGPYTYRFSSPTAGKIGVEGTISFDYTTESLSVTWSSLSATDRGPQLKPKIIKLTNFNGSVNPPVGPGITSAGGTGNFKQELKEDFQAIPVGPVFRFSKTATMTYG